MRPVRVVVVGAGHMGRLHAEKVARLPGAALVGIADRDGARAARLVERLGGRAAADPAELFAAADAAVVAVPTVAHHAVVRVALEAGLDVLVEKPIAAEWDEAEELVALAERRGRVLQVGHQEWFNPALEAVRGRIHAPGFIEALRVGPFTERATDVDVVRDLMIHDLDIIQKLLGEEPERIDAIGVPVLTDKVDVANARLVFPSGCVVNLTASRVSMSPTRKLRIFQRDGYFALDFRAQAAVLYRRRGPDAGGPVRIEPEERKGGPADTLREQLRAFLGSVRSRDVSPPHAGLGALRSALRVMRAMPARAPAR